jgi:hypothetical protein
MSKILEAVNIILASVAEEQVTDLTEPQALMAKSTLEFVLTELPYNSEDFNINYEEMPPEVYNLCVVRAVRKFQASNVGSEILHQFSQEDELSSKRVLIRKKLIPKALLLEVDEELEAMLPFDRSEIPKSLKDNLGILKFQSLMFSKPEEYVLSAEAVDRQLMSYKKNLILTRNVPLHIIKRVRDDYYSRYGFTGAIPIDVTSMDDASQLIKVMATWELQKVILSVDDYVISQDEKSQDEIDFRMALVTNKLYPQDLYLKVEAEFTATYGYTVSEQTALMKEHILFLTMWRLQATLIPQTDDRPFTVEDLAGAESALIVNLITPKALYERVLNEVKTELSIEEGVQDSDIPEAVFTYAKYRATFIHQPSAIRDPRRYVIDRQMVMRAKANASHALPAQSMMNSTSVSRLVNNDELPEVTAGNPVNTYRLKMSV